MRDEQRAGLRIDERARKARQRLGALRAAGGRVAGRQDHPIGVELQRRDLGGGEIAVVLLAGLVGRRQQKARLGIACRPDPPARRGSRNARCGIARAGPFRSIALPRARSRARRAGSRRISVHVACHGAKFVRCLGQRRLLAQKCNIGKPPRVCIGASTALASRQARPRAARPSRGNAAYRVRA